MLRVDSESELAFGLDAGHKRGEKVLPGYRGVPFRDGEEGGGHRAGGVNRSLGVRAVVLVNMGGDAVDQGGSLDIRPGSGA